MEIDNVLPSLWRRLLVQFHFTFFYLIELEKKLRLFQFEGSLATCPIRSVKEKENKIQKMSENTLLKVYGF